MTFMFQDDVLLICLSSWETKPGINPVDIFPAGMNVKGTSEEVIY